MNEDEIRLHEAFIPFKEYCSTEDSGNHPDDNEFCDWEFLWIPFLAGWKAHAEYCGCDE